MRLSGSKAFILVVVLSLAQRVLLPAELFVDAATCPAVGSGSAADPFCSVQDGVDAAAANDVVRVAPGTYSQRESRMITVAGSADSIEAVLFLKDGVQVVGSGAGSSRLDASGVSTVVVADHCGPGTALREFTLQGGSPGSAAGFNFGDGIFINEGSPLLENLEIESVEGGFAAVDVQGPAAPVLNGVTIHDNGQLTPLAAPVWIYGGGEITLRRSVIRDNHGVAAAGILVEDSGITLVSSVLSGNVAADGGAIRMVRATASLISGSTLVANTSGTAGAAIRLESSSPRISSCLVVSNRALTGQVGGIYFDGGSQPLVDHNDAFSNLDRNYQSHSDPTGADGNLSQDPIFRNFAAQDYRLTESSPAVDAGAPDALFGDVSGSVRPLDGDRSGSAAADMGAFEFDRWDVRGVLVEQNPSRLVWSGMADASGYFVYQGSVAGLAAGDFGSCLTLTGEIVDTQLPIPANPPGSTAWFFLVTARVDGAEGTRGFNVAGLERIPTQGSECP